MLSVKVDFLTLLFCHMFVWKLMRNGTLSKVVKHTGVNTTDTGHRGNRTFSEVCANLMGLRRGSSFYITLVQMT
jgi:hypothetical protein